MPIFTFSATIIYFSLEVGSPFCVWLSGFFSRPFASTNILRAPPATLSVLGPNGKEALLSHTEGVICFSFLSLCPRLELPKGATTPQPPNK
jgi:hypothetical protein